MRKKKECSTDGYSPVTCKTTFTYGNTVINVVECFPKEDPTITELLEKAIIYEGTHRNNKISGNNQEN